MTCIPPDTIRKARPFSQAVRNNRKKLTLGGGWHLSGLVVDGSDSAVREPPTWVVRRFS